MHYRNLRYRARVTAIAGGLTLAALLAACGGSTSSASSSPPTTAAPSSSASGTGPSTGGAFPGAVGSVAALSGSSMEVQNPQTGQVTVSWTPSTTFTQSATALASSVAVGDCVVATGTSSGATITARTVSISQPSASGSCTSTRPASGGFGRGGGNAPSGSRPAGRSGAPLSFASGKVTSVTTGNLGVDGTSASAGAAAPSGTAVSSNITIDLNASTTYTKTQVATATNLAVGDCVTATGSTGSTGAVTASSVRITSTGGQTCTAGFGAAGREATSG